MLPSPTYFSICSYPFPLAIPSSRYSNPFNFTSYSVDSSIPSRPAGNLFRTIHTTYGSGNRYKGVPLYRPYGIAILTKSVNTVSSIINSF